VTDGLPRNLLIAKIADLFTSPGWYRLPVWPAAHSAPCARDRPKAETLPIGVGSLVDTNLPLVYGTTSELCWGRGVQSWK